MPPIAFDIGPFVTAGFSALAGALLAGLVRYEQSVRERRVNVTVALHAEFHTPAFTELRIRAHDVLTQHDGGVIRAYPLADAAGKQAIYAVLHYFERVALLARSGVADMMLLRRFLRQYVGWWRPLLCGDGEPVRDDPEWSETLAEIDWLFDRIGQKHAKKRR